MEIPSVSATHGFARSLPAKLERLLDAEDNNNELQLSKGEKKKIGLLKDQLKQICEFLMDPSEVEFPASAAKCWLMEVRELSYDIDDFHDELVSKCQAFKNNPHGSKDMKRAKKWISSEVSRFRIRLEKAMQRYKTYSLQESKMRQQSCVISFDDERPPPPLFSFEPIGIDDSVDKVENWLTDGGEPKRRVVAVVGLGGVGKTTLANKLYRNLRKRFQCHAFVRSSQMPDTRELLTSILLQVRPHVPPDVSEWRNLTNTIRTHLQQKKYFIVIDGLWSLSTWDLILQALPDDDDRFSRILITTEVDAVAYRRCGHNSNYMLRMEPLSKDRSQELFFSRFGGKQPELSESSPEISSERTSFSNEISSEILGECGGFPLAIVSISSLLANQPQVKMEKWKYVWSSLSSNLKTNPTVKGMKQVISLCYNSLPDHLKTCMLYLSIYKQGHIIQKNDLVKQWIAEGFICAKQEKDIEEVASTYFDELVIKGMIQPVHNSHNGQVNSCTVHYMILQLIQCKSIEENFVITIHHSETHIRLGDKVRRLSLDFGDAEDAKPPDRLELSQVRTLAFYGNTGCMSFLAEFRLLRVIILYLWADQDHIKFEIPTFCKLRYLEIACNVKIMLQINPDGLQYLETLKIDSRRSEVPQDIVHLRRLLYLSLPGDTNMPNFIGNMSSLRTFGCFNLSSNSADNVRSLEKLTDLRDLHLTCSTKLCDNLEENFGILSSVLPKLNNLKSLTLLPAENSSSANILGASSTDKNIRCDGLLTVSPAPGLLEKLELSPRIGIFSRLPGWIGDLSNLSILKIATGELSQSDIDTLSSLAALSALLLYVSIARSKMIVSKEGFQVLKHFKFVCSTICIAFEEGAMPSLRSLKLGFNTKRSEHYSLAEAGFGNLKRLSAFSAKIGCAGAPEHGRLARSALEDALRCCERQPMINIQLVDRVFGCDEEKSTVCRTAEAQTPEKTDVIITGRGGPTETYQTETGDKNSSPAIEISPDAIRITLSSDHTSSIRNQDKLNRPTSADVTNDANERYVAPEIELWKTGDQVLMTDERRLTFHQTAEGLSESSNKHDGSINRTNVAVDVLNKPSSADFISEANETHASRGIELGNRKKAGVTSPFPNQTTQGEGPSKWSKKYDQSVNRTTGPAADKQNRCTSADVQHWNTEANEANVCDDIELWKKNDQISTDKLGETSPYHCQTPQGSLELTDVMVALAKLVVEGAVTKAQAAIEEEAKMQQSMQRDLVFIAHEMQMMQSFLNALDEKHTRNNMVVKTWVRQVRDLAYDMEDCIEYVIHLDKTSNCYWRCLPGFIRPELPLDMAVAEIKQLKCRVEDICQRRMRYNLISDSYSKPDTQKQLVPGASVGSTTYDMLVNKARDTTKMQRELGDLTKLLSTRKPSGKLGLGVIAVWAAGGNADSTPVIRQAYGEPEVCESFRYRGWAKLTHPFNPHDFQRSLLIQFHTNYCLQNKLVVDVGTLKRLEVAAEGELIEEYMDQMKKRYLVVLENVSSMEEWDTVRAYLPDKKNDSWVIISTQQSEVAGLCVGDPWQLFELKQSSAEHSVCVFFREGSQGDRDKSNNNEVSSSIGVQNNTDIPLVKVRESQMKDLRGYLARACVNGVPVISVWGVAGVGKSTLVRNLYYDKIRSGDRMYTMYGWVDVSHPFNLRNLAWSLLSQLQSDSPQQNGISNPIQECHELLEKHRCLVIIDGLQSTDEWDLIRQYLVSTHSRSIIVVITTEASIAMHCANREEAMYNVKSLEDDEAHDLFKKEVGTFRDSSFLRNSEDPELWKLISKCGGLPKVIVAVADFLAPMTISWMKAAMNLCDRFMHDLETKREFYNLRGLFGWMHNYFRTCPDYLKPCILYLSIFPQGQSIRRRRLVRRWIAEGYARDTSNRSAEDNGEKLFSMLLDLSIIQQTPHSITTADTRMVFCKVNGFFREYIISRQKDEDLVFELEGRCTLTSQRTGRHLVIKESWDRDKIVFSSIDFSRLRSLTVFGQWKPFLISETMKVLRILDLENATGVTDKYLGQMLKVLPRLKFLSLRGIREICCLPNSFAGLRHLETLDVRGTSIATLPPSITKLTKLQYIRAGTLSCDVGGVEVPAGIDKLTGLHTLGAVNIGFSGGKAILKELKKLTQLHKLEVTGINKKNCKEFCSVISDHVHLESLSVSLIIMGNNRPCLNDMFSPLENLQSLKLYGLAKEVPAWIRDLPKLTKLELEITMSEEIEVIKIIGELKVLCILRLYVKPLKDGDGNKLNFFVEVNGVEQRSYCNLKILEIACNSELDVSFGSLAMQNLELLTAKCCTGSAVKFAELKSLSEGKLKEVRYVGSLNITIKMDMENQLKQHPKTPALKLEEQCVLT